jgi:hypothetical protein
VEDVNAKPLAGVPVSFRLGAADCTLALAAPVTTDANGVAATAVTAGDRPGACEVTAVAGSAQATTKIAVYGAGTTHVWFGGTVKLERSYDASTNWLGVTAAREIVPTSSDTAFVPMWQVNMGPLLVANAALGGLVLEQKASVDLGGFTLTTTGRVSAADGRVVNGLLIAGGNAQVSGEFERLDVGSAGCLADKAALDVVLVKELRVVCTAEVVKQAAVTGNIEIGARAILTVTGVLNAKAPTTLRLLDAAQLIVNGTAEVGSCTPTLGVFIGGIGRINGVPAVDFLTLCKP